LDWLEFFGRYGLPTIILAAISIFFAKHVWPFIVRAWEQQQEERRAEREQFLKELSNARQQFLDELSNARKEFKIVMEAERGVRIDERNRFLEQLSSRDRSKKE
jgi:hypothetical protein